MTETAAMKKTHDRRRIPIQRIENKAKRSVALSKRKAGLFKKARELATLCGSEIAVVVFSEAGKAFTFGPDSVFQRFVHSTTQSHNSIYPQLDTSVDRMGLAELILYSQNLKDLRNYVAAKATSMNCSLPCMSDHLLVQEKSVGMHSRYLEELNSLDAKRAVGDCQLSDCFDWMEPESSVFGGDQGMMQDRYAAPETTNTSDFYDVQENCVDDVQLGDLYLSKSLDELINFDAFDSPTIDVNGDGQMMFVGEATMKDGYVQTDGLPSSSSFSYADLDAQWYHSLCDIQWEEDLDFSPSFLHH